MIIFLHGRSRWPHIVVKPWHEDGLVKFEVCLRLRATTHETKAEGITTYITTIASMPVGLTDLVVHSRELAAMVREDLNGRLASAESEISLHNSAIGQLAYAFRADYDWMRSRMGAPASSCRCGVLVEDCQGCAKAEA